MAAVAGCWLMGAALAGDPNAQQILSASDAVRYPGFPFGMVNTLIEYRNGKQTDTSTLASYNKLDPMSGQFRSLNRYIAPARDADKLFIFSGNDMWFYDPSGKTNIRLSPQQRMLGQAANGDVAITNYSRDYAATLAGEEDALDGERQNKHCFKLQLTAKTPEAVYHHLEMWIEVENNRPVKSRFYAESGALLKTAYYRHYQNIFGVERPTEMVIIDGLDPNWVTVMRYSDWVKRDVPEAWLQKDYLPRFKPE